MADVRPLRGVRFDARRTGPIGSLIAPPYDVAAEPANGASVQHSQDRKRRPRVRRRRPRPGRAALPGLAGTGCFAPRRRADDLRPPSSVRSGRHDGLANRVAGPGAPDRLVRAYCLASRADDARSQRGAPGSTAGSASEPESTLFPVQGSRRRDPAISSPIYAEQRAATRGSGSDGRDTSPDRCCRCGAPCAAIGRLRAAGRSLSPMDIIATKPRSHTAMNAGPDTGTTPTRPGSSFSRCWRRSKIPGSSCGRRTGS